MTEVAIVGMGTMGTAIHELLQDNYAVQCFSRGDDLSTVELTDMAIVAVKPQSFPELVTALHPHIERQIVISIMAGISIRALVERLGTDRIVRSMPNLALKIGQSTTAWYAVSEDIDTITTEEILRSWGNVVHLDREEDFHTFTAIAGSGPAYVFELAYQLEQAAVVQGLDKERARKAVISMIHGSADLMREDVDPSEQVRQVASRGGTTEAALEVFEAYGFGQMVNRVIAVERSRALGEDAPGDFSFPQKQ
jgi:pyrroline-5-carboxylate reductase